MTYLKYKKLPLHLILTFILTCSCATAIPSKFAAMGEMNRPPEQQAIFVIKEQDYKIENCKKDKIEIDSVGIKDSVGKYAYYFFGSAKNKEIVFLSMRYNLDKGIDKNIHQVITLRSKDRSCSISIGTIVQPFLLNNPFSQILSKKCDDSKDALAIKPCEKMHKDAEENINNFAVLLEGVTNLKLIKTHENLVFDYDPDNDILLDEFYEKTNTTFSSKGQPIMNEKSMTIYKNYIDLTGIKISNKPFN